MNNHKLTAALPATKTEPFRSSRLEFPRMPLSRRLIAAILSLSLSLFLSVSTTTAANKTLKAGAYAINVSPLKLPVIINGGMTERTADKITDPLHARCLVLEDGTTKVAMVVVDSCMMRRGLRDEGKWLASQDTGVQSRALLI